MRSSNNSYTCLVYSPTKNSKSRLYFLDKEHNFKQNENFFYTTDYPIWQHVKRITEFTPQIDFFLESQAGRINCSVIEFVYHIS